MRNLKKFLALVLAMMMVFGLMVTANAAPDTLKSYDDFTDAGEVTAKYQESLEVIIDLGVLQGYGGTDLMVPDGNLRRGELAAILYRMYTGNVTDAAEKADDELALMAEYSRFEDVDPADPSVAWCVGYVNYAAWKGWLNGYDNVRFGPGDSLTTVQMLTAVMRVLGIKVTDTGNWTLDTIQAAYDNGLVGSLDLSELQAPKATREQIANVALTALTYEPAEAKTGKWIVVAVENGSYQDELDGLTFSSYTEAYLVADGLAGDYDMGTDYTIEEEVDKTQTLGWDSFRLVKEGKADEYGRPATVYTKNGTVLVSKENTSALALTLDGPVTGTYLRNELGINAVITTANVVSAKATKADYAWAASPYATVVGEKVNPASYGGNGIHVEIYKDAKNTTRSVTAYTAVVIVPYIAKVSDVKTVAATAKTGAYTQYKVGDLDLRAYTSTVSGDEEDTVVVDGEVAKNDYVLVMYDPAEEVCTITKADVIEGTLSEYNRANNTCVIDGDTYHVSAIAGAVAPGAVKVDHKYALDAEGNVALDLGAVESTSSGSEVPDIIYALSDSTVKNFLGNDGDMVPYTEVTGIDQTGKLVTLRVTGFKADLDDEAKDADDPTGNDIDAISQSGGIANDDAGRGLYACEPDPRYSGRYLLTPLGDDDDGEAVGETNAFVYVCEILKSGQTDTITIDNDGILIAGTLYANNNTKFFVAVYDFDKEEYSDVKSYIGYTAIGYASNDIHEYLDGVDDDVDKRDGTSGNGVNVFVIDIEGDTIADYVFIDAYNAEPAAVKSYAYITGQYTETADGYRYPAVINGSTTTITLIEKLSDKIELPALVEIIDDGDDVTGVVLEATELADNKTAMDTTGGYDYNGENGDIIITQNNAKVTYTYNGGALMVKDTTKDKDAKAARVGTIGANVPVYLLEAGAVTKTTASAMGSISAPTIVIHFEENNGSWYIAAIYAVVDGEKAPEVDEDTGAAEITGTQNMQSVKKSSGKINVSGDGVLNVAGNIGAGSDITVADPTSVTVDGDCNEAIKVKPADEEKGLGVNGTEGNTTGDGGFRAALGAALNEGIIYAIDEEDLVGEGNSVYDNDYNYFYKGEEDALPENAVIVVKYTPKTASKEITVTVKDNTGAEVWTDEVTPDNVASRVLLLNLVYPDNETASGSGSNGSLSKAFVKNSYYTIEITDEDEVVLFEGGFTAGAATNAAWATASGIS